MYTLDDIKKLIEELPIPEEFDMVVAIANGGIIPAAMVNQRLGVEFNVIKINLRDASQRPLYDAPRLMDEITFDPIGRRILLVEDRVKSGATLALAKRTLEERGAKCVKTLAVNGAADYSLLDVDCFKFPWIISPK